MAFGKELINALNAPFAYEDYQVFRGFAYVEPDTIVARLNEVLGLDWEMTEPVYIENLENQVVTCHVGITIYHDGISRTRYHAGSQAISKEKDSEKLLHEAVGNAKKACTSDAIKKTASLFGVGLDLYASKIQVLKPDTTYYKKAKDQVIRLFKLDDYRFKKKYEEGIPVLPDEYRSFLETGIFWSDIYGNKQQNATQAPNKETENPLALVKNETEGQKLVREFKESTRAIGAPDEMVFSMISRKTDAPISCWDDVEQHAKILSELKLTKNVVLVYHLRQFVAQREEYNEADLFETYNIYATAKKIEGIGSFTGSWTPLLNGDVHILESMVKNLVSNAA